MSALHDAYEPVSWLMRITEEGYTSFELSGGVGVWRWGYVINAGAQGWDAHVGAFGRGPADHIIPPSVKHFDGIAEAKAWVEEGVAREWRRYVEAQPLTEPR